MINKDSLLDEYLQVLCSKKGSNCYTWQDISEIISEELGETFLANTLMKRAHRKGFICNQPITDDFSCSGSELQRIKDERIQANALYRRLYREDTILDIAKEAVNKLSQNYKFSLDQYDIPEDYSDVALLLLSDWHYGAQINNCMNTYSPDICRDRVCELKRNVVRNIKLHKIKKLYCLNLGDMISGIIHLQLRINSQIDVITQTLEVSEILANLLNDLSSYVEIEYYSVLDNHSRIDPNKKESIQLESFARITQEFLRLRLESNPRIAIKDSLSEDIALFKIPEVNNDFTVVGVHGDKDKKQIIIQNLNSFLGKIDLVCSAHLHHFSADENNGSMLISNGSLMGTDDFAWSKRLNSQASQTLIIFDKNNVNGIYKLNSLIYN